MNHGHAGVPHGGALPLIGPDTVGHQRTLVPEAVLGVGLPVLGAVRMQPPDPVHLRPVFRQVGLGRQPPLLSELPQKGHQPVRAGGDKPGGENWLDMGEILAGLQPSQRLPPGLLRGLLQKPRRAVAVHVHLSHEAGDAGLFQLFHQNERGVGVEGGEHAHPCGAAGGQIPGE